MFGNKLLNGGKIMVRAERRGGENRGKESRDASGGKVSHLESR